LALEDHLFKLGTYDKEKLISKINAAPDNEDIKAMRRRATIGEVSGRRYYEQILDWLEVRSEDREESLLVLHKAEANIALYPTVKETLPLLRARGFMLGVITNSVSQSADKLSWLRAQGLEPAPWQCFINSTEVGCKKPDHRIFHRALEALQLRGPEVVFVGHHQGELTAAKQCHMTTVLVNPDPNVTRDYDYKIELFKQLLDLPLHSPNTPQR
jgi:FMN phosphatase YigB (HAD superfamily)